MAVVGVMLVYTIRVGFHLFVDKFCYCEAVKVEEPAEEMETGSVETSPSPVELTLTPAEAFLHHQMHVATAKEQIATLCTAVISSPEDDVMNDHVVFIVLSSITGIRVLMQPQAGLLV